MHRRTITRFCYQVPLKSDSVTSFGDSGVERDMHMTPPPTPPISTTNPRTTERHNHLSSLATGGRQGMLKCYSDEWMPPVPEAQSFLRSILYGFRRRQP